MRRSNNREGSTLLLTLLVVSLLLVIVLSFVVYVRLNFQAMDQLAKNVQARQNALVALNIAIGQLQKCVGPDQRVTTTADLIANADKSNVPYKDYVGNITPVSTAARVTVQPGTRQWTAAWGNNQAEIGYDLKPDEISGRSVTPALLNWLISGNEDTVLSVNGTQGGVTAGTNIHYSPTSVVDLSNLAAPTINGDPAVLLVGPGTAGPDAVSNQDCIAAPLRPITAPADMGSIGNYAWWIGDDGVKALVNLQNGYDKTDEAEDRINSFITAQRAAIELMDRGDSNPISLDINPASPAIANLVPKVLVLDQLALLGDDATKKDHLLSATQTRFHDLTAYSRGVLSDTYAGGLKKDLSADLADTSSDFSYRPDDTETIFTPLSSSEPNLSTWGHLRSWADTVSSGSGKIIPQPANPTQAGIAPVMVYTSVGFEAYVESVDVAGVSVNTMRMAIYPVVLLCNPYSVTIAAQRYDVGVRFQAKSYGVLKSTRNFDGPGNPNWTDHAVLDLGALDQPDAFLSVPSGTRGYRVGGALTRSNYLQFTIDGQDIPPGETHVYRLDDTFDRTAYAPGKRLTRAPDPVGTTAVALGVTNALILPGTYQLPDTILDTDVLLLHSNISNGGKQCIDFVLAEEGHLADANRRYQHNTLIAGSHGANHHQTYLVHDYISSSTLNAWKAGGFTQAASAFRFGYPMESFINRMAPFFGMGEFHNMIWLRQGNFRAPVNISTRYESDPALIRGNPLHSSFSGTMLSGAVATNQTYSPDRDVALFSPTFGYATSLGGSTGSSYNHANTFILDAEIGQRLNRAIFFDVLDNPDQLLSLGQLQHVPFSRYSFDPTYPFGNAMGDIRVPRTSNYNQRENIIPLDPKALTTTTYYPAYDLSWHLNHALWDKYFVSGVPSVSGSSTEWTQDKIDNNIPLPNGRMTLWQRDGGVIPLNELRNTSSAGNPAYDRAAANLMVTGAFNINSTSEQAWRAILGATLGVATDPSFASTDDKVSQIVPYARFARGFYFEGDSTWAEVDTTMNVDVTQEKDYRKTNYIGNRGLWLNTQGTNENGITNTNTNTSALINELAKRIVLEIRRNGPFLSLSDFVNRPILATENPAGIKGPLQTAIDTMSPLAAQANPRPQYKINPGTTPSRLRSVVSRYPKWDHEHFYGGPLDIPASQMQQRVYPTQYAGEPGTDMFIYTNAFGPKYLTQADMLSTLGPALSARSDTFVIRTYGEKVNPVTQEVEGRAWCEAVLQRTPDYIGGEAAETATADLPANSASKIFGRSFKVVSFRWLNPKEI